MFNVQKYDYKVGSFRKEKVTQKPYQNCFAHLSELPPQILNWLHPTLADLKSK